MAQRLLGPRMLARREYLLQHGLQINQVISICDTACFDCDGKCHDGYAVQRLSELSWPLVEIVT